MKIDLYVNKIIEDTGLTRKEIQNLVEEKKEELKGLISDEGALFIIAKELGVDVKEGSKELLKEIEINVNDITQNMKNITLTGRIKEIYKVHNFNRKEGGSGNVGSFLLNDKTGDIRIVLWDDHIKIFENPIFNLNELIKIINGYAKKGRLGDIEIHIGRNSKIILAPEDVDYKKYEKIKSKIVTIRNINLNMKSISIEGKILQHFPIKEFTKKNDEKGRISSLFLMDSSASTIRITFWNEDTEKIKDVRINDYVSITNLNPRLNYLDSKIIDLHANNYTSITKQDKKIKIEENLIDKIKDLQNEKDLVSFQGVISSIDNLKNISLKSGEDISLLGFILSDDSDGIRVTIWRDKADEFSEILEMGMGVSLKNVLVKHNNFSGRKEISLINDSIIEIIDLKIKDIKEIKPIKKDRESNFKGTYSKISSINSSSVVEIKGFVATGIKNIIIYAACPICSKKVDNCTCNEKVDSQNRMIFNLIIDDESGTIRTTFFGDIAEKFIGEKTDIISQLKETPDFEKFLEEKSTELIGKDIIIKGRAKFSDFSASYEISVFDFQEVDVNEQLEKIIKEIEN